MFGYGEGDPLMRGGRRVGNIGVLSERGESRRMIFGLPRTHIVAWGFSRHHMINPTPQREIGHAIVWGSMLTRQALLFSCHDVECHDAT